MYIESIASMDDYWITIVTRVIQVIWAGFYIYGCIHRGIGEEASSHALKTLIESNNSRICRIMDPYIYLCL